MANSAKAEQSQPQGRLEKVTRKLATFDWYGPAKQFILDSLIAGTITPQEAVHLLTLSRRRFLIRGGKA